MLATVRRHLPSPAMAVALLALFVALSGSAYAGVQLRKSSVTSRAIKDKTIQGRDVKSNTLTGKQIDESTLATVPRANSVGDLPASSLVTADDFVTFNRGMNRGTADTVLQTFGPLTLAGNCEINGASNFNMHLLVNSSAANTWIFYDGTTDLSFGPGDPKTVVITVGASPTVPTHATKAIEYHDPASGLTAQGSVTAWFGFPGTNCRYTGSFVVTRP